MSDHILKILHHDGSEEVKSLVEGDLTVGRGPDNWLCPVDPALSRQHAVLHISRDRCTIEDLATRNGTLVNGQSIDGTTDLAFGDVIELGKTKIVLMPGDGSSDSRRVQPTVEISGDADLARIVAETPVMQALIKQADIFARSNLPVLITGETGTGKELFAYRVHFESSRRDKPFVILNCPALAPGVVESELFGVEAGVATDVRERSGRLEEADGGTLFLDEVGDLSLEVQAKLLRFLQDGTIERVGGRRPRKVDVRLVAATNQDLDTAMAEGRFRNDLYFRIAAVRLDMPPLREHRDDIRPLVDYLLARRNLEHVAVDELALQALEQYDYPGNIRELDAIVSRAAALAEGKSIQLEDIALRQPENEPRPPIAWDPHSMLESVVSGEISFWEVVHQPFIDRELPRSLARKFVAIGLERSGGSVKSLAQYMGEEEDYRRLLDFLRNNRLLP